LPVQALPVAQQQPAAGLDHPAGRLVIAQLIGLVHAHLIDHLAAVLGHDMEQVVDNLGVGTVGLDL